MRMSTKIYLNLCQLAFVSVIIMGLGIYGIWRMSDELIQVNQAGSRAEYLAMMEAIINLRRAYIRDVLLDTDEASMEEIIKGPLANTEKEMATTLLAYEAVIPADASADLRSYPDKIRALWQPFVEVTSKVSALSLENSNQKAIRLTNSMTPVMNTIDTKVNEILTLFKKFSREDDYVTLREIQVSMMYVRRSLMGYSYSAAVEDQERFRKEINETLGEVEQKMERLIAGVPSEQGGKELEEQLRSIRASVSPYVKNLIDLVSKNSNLLASKLMQTEGTKVLNAVSGFTTELQLAAREQKARTEEAAMSTSRFITWLTFGLSMLGLAIGITGSTITMSAITKRLTGIVTGMSSASVQVSGAADSLSSSAQSLSEGATEQAASLEETSSALEQMASMTRQNADNATQTNTTTVANNKLIGEGATAVKNMSSAMAEISDSAEKISRIIKVIEEIAFQTNLLALNAAVEAARAGEAGKGFAVVADEVRNLAQRSAQAAKDTTELIQGTVERVKNGTGIAEELMKSFSTIESGSQRIGQLIGQITGATNEQAQGVDQVNTAVAQMDKVTQQNAANAEASATAAEELSAQAGTLNSMVDDLTSLVLGQARQRVASRKNPRQRAADAKAAPEIKPASRTFKALPPPSANRYEPAAAKNKPVVMKPSDVIPLDGDEDFKDF